MNQYVESCFSNVVHYLQYFMTLLTVKIAVTFTEKNPNQREVKYLQAHGQMYLELIDGCETIRRTFMPQNNFMPQGFKFMPQNNMNIACTLYIFNKKIIIIIKKCMHRFSSILGFLQIDGSLKYQPCQHFNEGKIEYMSLKKTQCIPPYPIRLR